MATKKDDGRSSSAAQIVAEVVAQNPDMQAKARKIASDLLASISYTMAFGRHEDRVALQRSVVPAMLKSLTSVEEAEQEQEKAAAYARLREALGGEA